MKDYAVTVRLALRSSHDADELARRVRSVLLSITNFTEDEIRSVTAYEDVLIREAAA